MFQNSLLQGSTKTVYQVTKALKRKYSTGQEEDGVLPIPRTIQKKLGSQLSLMRREFRSRRGGGGKIHSETGNGRTTLWELEYKKGVKITTRSRK